MEVVQSLLKNISKVALAAMGALFVLGVVYYKERVLFADGAFVLFNIINEKRLYIQEHRFGSFITQMFPYFGQKFHLPIKTIMLSYGASFHFVFLLISVLIYKCREYALVILMALYYFLFVSQSYIWVNEIFQATGWMFLFFAVILYLGKRKANILLILLSFSLAFLAVFTHFAVFIPTLFLWVYLILEQKNWPFSNKISLLLSACLVLIIGLKYWDAHSLSAYDAEHLKGLKNLTLADITHSVRKPVVKIFLRRCVSNYWLGILVLITSIGALIADKKQILAAWTLLSFAGYLSIMGLCYGSYDDTTLLMHIESEWSCISIIGATPFVFNFLPRLKPPKATVLLSGIFIVRLVYIMSFLPSFTLRNDMEERLLTQMRKKGITKLAIYNDQRLRDTAILDWALPYESMIMSSMDHDPSQLNFLFVNPDDKETISKLNGLRDFYNVWNIMPIAHLNKAYYNLDSVKPYQVMTYEEFMK